MVREMDGMRGSCASDSRSREGLLLDLCFGMDFCVIDVDVFVFETYSDFSN